MPQSYSTKSLLIALSAFIICAALYSFSLSVPFYLDDFQSIVNNKVLIDVEWSRLAAAFPMRELGYWSFAKNIELGGLHAETFRAVNILLHLLMGGLVYWLAQIFTDKYHASAKYLPIIASAIYLLAPLNSQAVIYIVQRVAVLSAIFYVLSIISYLKGRNAQQLGDPKHYIWFALCVLAFIAGLHTKQNIVTLPIALFALECFYIRPRRAALFWKTAAVGLGALLVFQAVDYLADFGVVARIDALTTETTRLTRWEYFTHQLVAIWVYIGKFFVPYPLLLEYSSKPYTWSDSITWLALFGHVAVITAAVKLHKQAPLISTLVALFYISHAVESSFIPIADLMFEHRAYLPNAFLAILVGAAAIRLISYKPIAGVLSTTALLILFASLLVVRIQQWQKPLAFYRNELTHTSDNARIYGALGAFYANQGKLKTSMKWYKSAIQVGAETGHLQSVTILNYVRILRDNDQHALANRFSVLALPVLKDPREKAKVLIMMAELKAEQGLCDFAKGLYERAVKLDPLNTGLVGNHCLTAE